LPTPTRNKCKFLGWSLNSGAPVESVEIAQGTHENRTYVARWTMDDVLTFTLAEGVTLEMRRCPAGTFQMGSPTTENGRYNNETQHSVTISKDFWMGTYEVTQEQYFVIMGTNPSQFRDNTNKNVRPTTSANYPVEYVASTYILTESTGFNAKLNASLTAQLAQLPFSYKFDLPTEAQWEYACRAGTTKALNNDKDITNIDSEDSNLNEVAWYKQNWGTANNKPHTVGGKAPNAWGLYDMHGNVSEWCKDRYEASYYQDCIDNNITTDPFLPLNNSSSYRVWRGGAWDKDPKDCRSATRSCSTPDSISNYRGFRLVLVAAE
jgi:formylglycine-generating enzyme required for sulfatase activity